MQPLCCITPRHSIAGGPQTTGGYNINDQWVLGSGRGSGINWQQKPVWMSSGTFPSPRSVGPDWWAMAPAGMSYQPQRTSIIQADSNGSIGPKGLPLNAYKPRRLASFGQALGLPRDDRFVSVHPKHKSTPKAIWLSKKNCPCSGVHGIPAGVCRIAKYRSRKKTYLADTTRGSTAISQNRRKVSRWLVFCCRNLTLCSLPCPRMGLLHKPSRCHGGTQGDTAQGRGRGRRPPNR